VPKAYRRLCGAFLRAPRLSRACGGVATGWVPVRRKPFGTSGEDRQPSEAAEPSAPNGRHLDLEAAVQFGRGAGLTLQYSPIFVHRNQERCLCGTVDYSCRTTKCCGHACRRHIPPPQRHGLLHCSSGNSDLKRTLAQSRLQLPVGIALSSPGIRSLAKGVAAFCNDPMIAGSIRRD
jgi:hypothetical protein